jgi:hypothetical protein
VTDWLVAACKFEAPGGLALNPPVLPMPKLCPPPTAREPVAVFICTTPVVTAKVTGLFWLFLFVA